MAFMSLDTPALRSTLGGALKPGDPRRFLIEAMVGAMHADGEVDEREMTALRGMLERHDLFAALPWDTAKMLIDMSTDAILFAGSAEHRIPVMARHLRWRVERLAAFAMAAEVCAADEVIVEREQRYLTGLRIALRLDHREHDELLIAARANRALQWLEAETSRVHAQLPVLAELMVLRRWSTGSMTQNDLDDIGESLLGMRDFGASTPRIDSILTDIARRARGWSSTQLQMSLIAAALVYPSDRYWTTVYLLADEIRRGRENWRSNELLLMLSAEMRFGQLQMELATNDANQLVDRTRPS
jgi:uncharacterized tellurite resistance protein B-like protein